LETWVFVAVLALIGLLVALCGVQPEELNFLFIGLGATTASLGSLIFNKKFKRWLEKI
jgi:hypothetical protein